MKTSMRWAVAFAALWSSVLCAQDITGTWQGTMHAAKDLRTVVKISKADGGGLKGVLYVIDQSGQGIPINSITLQGSTVKFAIPSIGGTYEGKLSNSDGTAITGFWTQGPTPRALDLALVNEKAAWAIPDAPPPLVQMAPDAKPQFEVATIKPGVPGAPGKAIRVGGAGGAPFTTLNTSLIDLITFAYSLQPRQITEAPAWAESDLYDLAAKFDRPGVPSEKQLKEMLQKLMADRFKLSFHMDKKELSVFVVTQGKTGPKLTESADNAGALPGLFFRGLGDMVVRNATIANFANLMQSSVLDRPVVDQTGLKGRYDFTLRWTPDETQFGGRGGKLPPPPDGGSAPPDLFAAMQAQLGLKLEAAKAPVDVLAIDHVEKPSDN